MSATFFTRSTLKKPRFQLGIVLILALLLRLGQVWIGDPQPNIESADYTWYSTVGSTLVTTGWTHGPVQTGPIFLLVAGYAEQLSAPDPAFRQSAWLWPGSVGTNLLFPATDGGGRQLVRVLHVLLSALTVYMVYRIGRQAWNHPVGLVAALALAIGPAFVIEAGNLATETISLFLLTWALAVWMDRIDSPDWRLMAAVGGLLGLAALTRAVFLVFPAVLVLHLGLKYGTRRMVRDGAILLLALAVTLASWTAYNLVQWDRFVIAGEGLLGTLFRGAVDASSAESVDAALEFDAAPTSDSDAGDRQEAFLEGVRRAIFEDLPGYVARRAGQLTGALLQPHNTAYYPGESIRDLAVTWLGEDHTPGGLIALAGADHFWPKLLLYVFHYTALLLGAVGMWRDRRRWRDLWPLYGLLAYVLAAHLALEAIPRYLFPGEPIWWLFAAGTFMKYALMRGAKTDRHGFEVGE